MLFSRLPLVSLLFMAGCAGPQSAYTPSSWPWPFVSDVDQNSHAFSPGGQAGAPREFSFEWQLSGDPEIMPIQVFDDGASMWLQFAPEGAWPAVFEVRNGGWRPLSYRRETPYMVLDGQYEHLELRGGHLRGSIRRPTMGASAAREQTPVHATVDIVPSTMTTAAAVVQASPVTSASPVTPPFHASQAAALTSTQPLTTVPGTGPLEIGQVQSAADASVHEYLGVESPSASFLGTPVPRYSVSAADQTIRQALERWAREAGWTFSSEHWAVDVDVPLIGQAAFDTDFKAAVRELLAATEMGDRPLQPCFYSNRVLRVVPYAQACDRSAATRSLS